MSDVLSIAKDVKRPHRAPKAGAKAKKKDPKRQEQSAKAKNNNRAFSVANIGRTRRNVQRNLDIAQRKEVVPQLDRSEEAAPPPVVVVVMGPPGCGKSTLIRSMVKYHTSQSLNEIKASEPPGPVTVVAGKKRRLTFFECPNDVTAMVDLAKVADLVLLLIDASFGFEMETFEFLNILQARRVHGFPKVMGVLTHLDQIHNAKLLSKSKRRLKQRFWTEIYAGAKVLQLGGITNNKYPKAEVRQLALHASRVKFRPLVWRNTHPSVLVDRCEDVTHPAAVEDDPACDRDVTMYGFVRGTSLKPGMQVHLIGAGDFAMAELTVLEDPIPLPTVDKKAVRSLSKKTSLLYAPMSNVGAILMDQDAVYIDIGRANYTDRDKLVRNVDDEDDSDGGETVGGAGTLLKSLQGVKSPFDEKMRASELRLFDG
ncbi:unnamed protein product, partial [Phaeothamnion confervicola]